MRFLVLGLSATVLCACQPATHPASSEDTAQAAAPVADRATPAEPVFDEAAFAAMEARYLGKDRPSDPIEELDWREVTCNFLGGEIGGDPEQDRAVNARLDELRCGDQNADARAMRATHAGDAELVARIDAYLARHPDAAL